MTVLRAGFHFQVSGLCVHSAILGTRRKFDVLDHHCTLVMPANERDFDNDDLFHNRPSCKVYLWDAEQHPLAAAVNFLRVEVDVHVSFSAAEFNAASDAGTVPPQMEELRDAMAAAADAAREGVRRYVGMVRVRFGQHWAEPSSWTPRLSLFTDIYEGDNRLRTTFLDPIVLMGHSPDQPLVTPALHDDLIGDVVAGNEPPLADQLLADALHAGFAAQPADLRIGTLFAAVACEVAVKDTLRRAASEGQVELVDVLLTNPRDYSMAAATLFHKGMKAVCGRSLSDENNGLFSQVQALFKTRNKIAHSGGVDVDEAAMRAAMLAARAALEWLRTVA